MGKGKQWIMEEVKEKEGKINPGVERKGNRARLRLSREEFKGEAAKM